MTGVTLIKIWKKGEKIRDFVLNYTERCHKIKSTRNHWIQCVNPAEQEVSGQIIIRLF
jgi:hypothetical protein